MLLFSRAVPHVLLSRIDSARSDTLFLAARQAVCQLAATSSHCGALYTARLVW